MLVSLLHFAVIEPVWFVCIIISHAKSLDISRQDLPDFVVAVQLRLFPPAVAIVVLTVVILVLLLW